MRSEDERQRMECKIKLMKSGWIYVSPLRLSLKVFCVLVRRTVCICMCVILIVALSLLLSSVRRVCLVLTYGAAAVYLHLN